MSFTIPNESVATYAPQSGPDSVDIDALVAGDAGTAVVSGCAVSTPAVAGRTVDVTAGRITVAGATVAVSAVASLAVGVASATDRKDIVVVNSSGVVSVVAGTAATATTNGVTTSGNRDPVKPAIPANSVLLAEIYVNAGIGNMAAGNIVDKRVMSSGAWTAYTPTFTNCTSANGNFFYQLTGKTLIIRIHFTAGTATAAGTIKVGLPPTGASPMTLAGAGTQGCWGNGVPAFWSGVAGANGLTSSGSLGAGAGLSGLFFTATLEIA